VSEEEVVQPHSGRPALTRLVSTIGAPPMSLVIEYCHPAVLKPDPKNPREHPKRQIDQLVASILAFGFTNPILTDETGLIIAGHGRLRAAKQLGLDSVPVIRLTGLSEAKKRALRLADNKIAFGSAWDADLLQMELQSISELEVDFDLTVTGFSTAEIDISLGPAKRRAVEDVIPATPRKPVTRTGDIWLMGSHRVGCGDCRNLGFVCEVVGSEKVDAAFLDPPYNVKINGNAVSRGRHQEFLIASGELSSLEFKLFLNSSLSTCATVSRSGAVHFICMDHRHIEELSAACAGVYAERLNICVWNKSNAGMGSLYRSKHELVFVMRVGDSPHFNAVELGRHGRNRSNVWDYASVNTFTGSRRHDLELHPTVKPSQLVADAIMDVSRRGELVLDVFLGSGTTLVAAERTERRFRGMDLDAAYVDVAVQRWIDLTGRPAVHAVSGESFAELQRARAEEGPNG
jgi:DNA modification methylase